MPSAGWVELTRIMKQRGLLNGAIGASCIDHPPVDIESVPSVLLW